MELRSSEEQVQEMMIMYQSLRETEHRLPDIAMPSSTGVDNIIDGPSPLSKTKEAADVLSTLESLRERLNSLEPRTERFRKRLDEKDPIPDAPRYGEKTASRVKALLVSYDALVEAIRLAFEGDEQDDIGRSKAVVQDLQNIAAQQKEEAQRAALEEEVRQRKLEEQEKEQVKQRLKEEERLEEEARLAREWEERELARRAQEVRAARQEAEQRASETERRMRLERERADREWMDSIAKGPDGVRAQLQRMREGTADNPVAFQTALHALHTLFSQILSRPEEANFRRVRRAHPKFNEDIGQHVGGCELLIAAGFRLGTIDDVPCFISTEPDIEKEMDAWAEWFELLKVTLEILKQEMLK